MAKQILIALILATLAELSLANPMISGNVNSAGGDSNSLWPDTNSVNVPLPDSDLIPAQTQIFRPLFVYRRQVARRNRLRNHAYFLRYYDY